MARDLAFLDAGEGARVVETARTWVHLRWWPGLDVSALLTLVLRTGIHVDVLARPDFRRLRVEVLEGITYVRWNRPKKTGADAAMAFPIPEAEGAAVRRAVDQVRARPYRRLHYHRLFRELGRAAGVPRLSPLVLRHTAIEWTARTGISTAELCGRFGITPRTALMYQKGPMKDRDVAFLQRLAPGALPYPGAGGAGPSAGT